MAQMRDRPYTGANFLVAIGDGDGREAAAGFAEVVFPPFVLDHARAATPGASGDGTADASDGPPARRLVLRRGVTGSLDLYRWWDEARRSTAASARTVTIALLDDNRAPVLVWRFHRAYPVSVSYSPLRALEGGIVMETVELAFGRVEMS